MNKRDWINKNSEIYMKVQDIVSELDIAGIMTGVPIDEYEPEIIDILNKCKFIKTQKDMACQLQEIFDWWFTENGYDRSLLGRLARDLVVVFNA